MNTELPLLTQPLDTATPLRQSNIDQQNTALNHEKILSQHYETLDAREKSRLTSVVSGAVQLESFLKNNDLDGAHNFLVNRRNAIQNRMANGENLDTEDTDAALQMLRTGNVEELMNNIQGLKAAGQVYGILAKNNMPSNVQEWQYYNNLSPQDQERYLTMKRSNQVVNLNDRQIVPSQVNPAGSPQASYPVGLKPENQPQNVEAAAAAELRGKGEIPEAEKSSRGKGMVTNLVNKVIPQVQELGDSGGAVSTKNDTTTNLWASTKASDVGQFVQRITGSEEQSIRNKIKTQKPALINAIRQATGMSAKAMDSNAELQFYLQQVGDEKTDVESQLFALKMIDEMYGNGGADMLPQQSQSGRIKIRDPKTGRTGTIDATQVQSAKQQGYEVLE